MIWKKKHEYEIRKNARIDEYRIKSLVSVD